MGIREQGRYWFKVAWINLLMLLAGAVLAEVVFGGWFFGPQYGSLIIPKNFHRHFDASDLYPGGGTIVHKRDENGFRGPYEDVSKIDILAMGGSTTNERFITEGETWVDVVRREFAGAGRAVSIVNAGVDGQSTIGHIKDFDLWFPLVPNLKARYILAYVGINDVAYATSGKPLEGEHLLKSDHMTAPTRRAKQYIRNNSALYALARNVWGVVRARNARAFHAADGFDGSTWRAPPQAPDIGEAERKYAAALEGYDARLRELTRRIEELGAIPIYVTQHRADYRVVDGTVLYSVRKDGTLLRGDYAVMMAFNRKTMEVCRDLGGICIDLAAELNFGENELYDWYHTTPRGSDKVGRYLFSKLKDVIR
jgi:hypothetical protein